MVSIFEEINQERAQKGLPPIIGTKPTTGENSPTSTLNFITGAQALGLGAADMANSTVLGFGGQLLATLGDLIERVSPFSGEGISENDRKIFNKWGYTDEEINAKYPREDSWITSAAKSTLQQGLENQDYLRQLELETLGDNPSYGVRATRGTGTSLSYALLGALAALAGGGPFTVAAAMGIPEAASESGGTMIDAYRQGRYDDGGVAAANKAFLANVPVNVGLDFFLNPINGKAFVGGIKDPLLRWLGKGAASIANEGLQEPSQDTISEAAMNSLNKGTGFMSELGEGLKQWPERAWKLFPEVAGSTALTHLIMGVLPGNIPGSIAHEYAYNRHLEQGQQSAPQIKETVDRLTNDPLIETLKERLDEAGKKEVSNLQADMEAVIKNLNTVGYNDYQGLTQNLAHLENIKQAMQNYGKSVSEIKMNTIQEQQRQAYTQAQAQIQAMQAAQAEQQRVAAENAAQREYLRQWREANPPTVETTPEIKALPSGLTEQNKQAPTQELKQQPTQQQEQKPATIEETPDIIEGAENNTGHAKTSEGTQVDFRYRVMEADDLVTSHLDNFSLNPNYDQALQGRNRNSQASQLQIEKILNVPS